MGQELSRSLLFHPHEEGKGKRVCSVEKVSQSVPTLGREGTVLLESAGSATPRGAVSLAVSGKKRFLRLPY